MHFHLQQVRLRLKTLKNNLIEKFLLATRIVIIAVCFFTAFGGHYPPAFAQRSGPQQIPLTTEDAMQDDHITAINKHLEATDANVSALRKLSDEQSNDMSSWRGGIATALTIIGLLAGGGIVLQFKQTPAK